MQGIDEFLALFAGDVDHTDVCLISQTIGNTFLDELYIKEEFGYFALCNVSLFIHQHNMVLIIWILLFLLITNTHSGYEPIRLIHCPVIESQDGVCLAVGRIGPLLHLVHHLLSMFYHQCLKR